MLNLVRWDEAYAAQLAPRFSEIDRLPAAMRTAVAYAFARTSGAAALPELLARARSAADEDGAQTAAEALGGLPNVELLARSLTASLEPGIRASVAHEIVVSVAHNPIGRSLTWEWLKQNLRELEDRTRGSWALSRLLERTIHIVGLGRREEVEKVLREGIVPRGGERGPEVPRGLADHRSSRGGGDGPTVGLTPM